MRQIDNFKVHIFRQEEGGSCILVGESGREEEGVGQLANCVATKAGDRLTAYACYILNGDSQFALLDYFAVIPELRDCGIGSSFLKALRENVPVGVGAFAEAESPADAKSDTEKMLRERRIRFYVTNGAVLTDMKRLLFGVNYDILFLAAGNRNPAPGQLQIRRQRFMRHDIFREKECEKVFECIYNSKKRANAQE